MIKALFFLSQCPVSYAYITSYVNLHVGLWPRIVQRLFNIDTVGVYIRYINKTSTLSLDQVTFTTHFQLRIYLPVS